MNANALIKITVTYLDRKGGGGAARFRRELTNYDHVRTCFEYGGGVIPGRRAESGVGYRTLPRAQNRAAKGSILLGRRSTLSI